MKPRVTSASSALHHARWLVGCADIAWLTSFPPGGGGRCLGSPVDVVPGADGSPLFLVPADSPHRSALLATGVARLLYSEPALGSLRPADVAQVTLLGRAGPVPAGGSGRAGAYVRAAQALADAELDLFRLEVTGARYSPRPGGGLTEVSVPGRSWHSLGPTRPPADLSALVDHLQAEHADHLHQLLAYGGGPADARAVVVSDLRPERLALTALTSTGVSTVRVFFSRPVATAADLAGELLRRIGRVGWGPCTRTRPASPSRPGGPRPAPSR